MTASLPRRRFLASAGAFALAACGGSGRYPERGPVVAMFPGRIDDGGFMASAYGGLERIGRDLAIPVQHVERIGTAEDAMLGALRELAASDATLVIAVGQQAQEAVQRVAWEFPAQRFASIQGELLRPNLAAYDVLQEQSAWLAGAAAGLLTKTGVVGHLSGTQLPANLRARAAFAGGLRTTNAKAKLLTTFSGSQDDPGPNMKAAIAQIDAGADLLFTVLGSGRSGAIDACRARGVKQIGNVTDWVAAVPDVFVGSAYADIGLAVYSAGRDLRDNLFRGDLVRRFGAANRDAVRLILADSVPEPVKTRVASLGIDMATGRIAIPSTYSGPEFPAA